MKLSQYPLELICATNADLEEAVRQASFRQDFYYRINVFRLHLRPLRERMEGHTHLCQSLSRRLWHAVRQETSTVSQKRRKRLMLSYSWPGNIRELRNAIERAIVLERESLVQASNLPIYRGEGQ